MTKSASNLRTFYFQFPSRYVRGEVSSLKEAPRCTSAPEL